MKKEDLIIKWLDNSLDEKELKAFEQLDASSTFMKIDEAVKAFKAPALDKKATFHKIQALKESKQKVFPFKQLMAGVAALLVIALGVYFSYFQHNTTTYFAQNKEHNRLTLPDQSSVILNAASEITYETRNWSSHRTVTLKGEAFFDVEKGSTFTVSTEYGTVQVLGTEFNVKVRPDYFEVLCYEGLVAVNYQNERTELPAGSGFRLSQEQLERSTMTSEKPSWIQGESSFISVTFSEIIEELERQYDIQVSYDPALSNTILTTSFTHKNLDAALQAITIPLNLSYDYEGTIVMLKPSQL